MEKDIGMSAEKLEAILRESDERQRFRSIPRPIMYQFINCSALLAMLGHRFDSVALPPKTFEALEREVANSLGYEWSGFPSPEIVIYLPGGPVTFTASAQ